MKNYTGMKNGIKKITNFLKKLSTRSIVISVCAVALIFWRIVRGRYQAHKSDIQAQKDMIYTVATWDLYVQVKVNAKASLLDEQNLSFGQEWKIASVNVHVGDEVKVGDVLAELDLKDYQNAIKAAELELENAQLGLKKLLNNDTSLAQAKVRSQIKEAQLALAVESDQYDILKKQLDAALQQKKDALQQLNREYVLAKNELDIATVGDIWTHASANVQDRQQKIYAIVSDLNSILWDMETTVQSIDKTLGITSAYRYQADNYSAFVSAQNPNLRTALEKNANASYALITNFESKIAGIDNSDSDNAIYAIVQDFYAASLVLITLSNTALDISNMSSDLQLLTTTISTYRSTIVWLRSQLKTLKDWVNAILSSYDTHNASLLSQSDSIDLLTREIATLEKDNPNQLARKQAQITNLNEQIYVLNQELRDVIDGVDAYDIQQQRNLISQAELKIERTKNQQDDYQIVAEFDGRVRTVDITEGEQYKLDDKDYVVVENPNLIELKLQVSQIDIVKIKEWQSVTVTFDSYPNTPIEAIVTSRNVNPQPNQRWGVYYEAVVLLEKQDLEILAWMSALVTVNVAESKNTLVVPTLAIVHQNGKTYVYLQEENTYALHEIQVGISNNFQAEVLSGLNVWDIILISILDEKTLKDMGIDGNGFSVFK